MDKCAILWCREGEDYGVLCFLDFNGKHWEETRISAEVGIFSYFTVSEAKEIAFARPLFVQTIGERFDGFNRN